MKINMDSIKILKDVLDSTDYSLSEKFFNNINKKFSYKIAFYSFLDVLTKKRFMFFRIKKSCKNKKLLVTYKLFLMSKKVTIEESKLLFSENELDVLIKDKLVIRVDNSIFSNYVILPYENKYFLIDNCYGKRNKYLVYSGPETILFLNNIKNIIFSNQKFNILDVGTGPGTIAINMMEKAKNITACDINKRAIDFAKINLMLNKIPKNRIRVKKCNYEKLLTKYKFDLIVSNPPFLAFPQKTKKTVPIYANGGKNGLEFTSQLIKNFYNSKSRRLFLVIMTGNNIIEILNRYNMKIEINVIREHSKYFIYNIYKNVFNLTREEIKEVSENFEENNIDRFYTYVIYIKKGSKKIKINTLYKLPIMIKFIENLYFKFKCL